MLLPWLLSRVPETAPEALDLFQRQAPIFVGIHRFEHSFVARLKLLE